MSEDGHVLPGRRILVAGSSGAGKSTLARQLGGLLDMPYVELDALFHGPNWVKRPGFEDDVDAFSSKPAWVCEWQYRSVRQRLLERADTLVWLDYPRALVMRRVIMRTVRRSVRNEELWNGNREPGLFHAFTNPEGIIRWSWETHAKNRLELEGVWASDTHLKLVRLGSPAATDSWLRFVAEAE